ncbi:hypothetical protein STIUS_v1c00760 [Spiroplasma sp. TIUS-1]|uniref:hypothetical protein n=1 Tax=Spiroplasma sp. TIUS-1 TaxID=216963 RepID=UPI001398A332|nr:hypothetical protein [Spiroplasma sp. TIUS-1]QHX35631.1 hypothetical protein STIUS_v1c00760 [Spiroplasma sp. TIUS-1]
MKKLYALLGTIAISITSAATLVSCSFLDTHQISIDNKIKNLMKSSSHWFKPAITAYTEGYNGPTVRKYLSSRTLGKFENTEDSTKMSNLFSLYFSDETMNKFSEDIFNQPGFDNPVVESEFGKLVEVASSLVNFIHLNIKGFEPELFLKIALPSLTKTLIEDDKMYNIFKNLEKHGNNMDEIKAKITDFATKFEKIDYNISKTTEDIKTYNSLIEELKINSKSELISFYNTKSGFTQNDIRFWAMGNFAEVLALSSNFTEYNYDKLYNSETFLVEYTKIIEKVVEGNLAFDLDKIKVKLTNFIMGLTWYVQAFDNYINQDATGLNDVFSKTKTNFEVFTEVQSTKIETVDYFSSLKSNWGTILQVVTDILKPNENGQINSQNTRILKILFQPDEVVDLDGENGKNKIGFKISLIPPQIKWGGEWAKNEDRISNGIVPLFLPLGEKLLAPIIREKIPSWVSLLINLNIDKMSNVLVNYIPFLLSDSNASGFFSQIKNDSNLSWLLKLLKQDDVDKYLELGEMASNQIITSIMSDNLIGKVLDTLNPPEEGKETVIDPSSILRIKIPLINKNVGELIEFLISGTFDNVSAIAEAIKNISNALKNVTNNIEASAENIQGFLKAFTGFKEFNLKDKMDSGVVTAIQTGPLNVSYDDLLEKVGASWMKDIEGGIPDFFAGVLLMSGKVKSFKFTYGDRKNIKPIDLSYEILGYQEGNYTEDGLMRSIQKIWDSKSGYTGNLLDGIFNLIKLVLDQAKKTIIPDPHESNYMKVLNDNRYSTELIEYKNFSNTTEPSYLKYLIKYKDLEDQIYEFEVEIHLDPTSDDKKYKDLVLTPITKKN